MAGGRPDPHARGDDSGGRRVTVMAVPRLGAAAALPLEAPWLLEAETGRRRGGGKSSSAASCGGSDAAAETKCFN